MEYSKDWEDYELIDASLGYKYERWGKVYLLRPDPVAIWNNGNLIDKYRGKIDAIYYRSREGGGEWKNINNIPPRWQIKYKDYTFNIKQMGFKHTGLFPEQAVNWDYINEKLEGKKAKVLNLFAYTGGTTVAALKAGASVVHVDSSKGMVSWAKENVNDSGANKEAVRYIVDDVIKFVKREIRRGNKYDAIIMDPPSYGRGANGEVWSLEKDLDELVKLCSELLSDKPILFLINSYSGLSPVVLENILKSNIKYKGKISVGEVGLKCTNSDFLLPCGIYGRWEND
ncbi:MAG: class I SAM-dependent methyltransferase [Bacilli bacterium]|nr:class I SAM-dependent methyltransferase [Bacilli bacterium]